MFGRSPRSRGPTDLRPRHPGRPDAAGSPTPPQTAACPGAWHARRALEGWPSSPTRPPAQFDHGDITGFEDGTENPTGEDRLEVATIAQGPAAVGPSSWPSGGCTTCGPSRRCRCGTRSTCSVPVGPRTAPSSSTRFGRSHVGGWSWTTTTATKRDLPAFVPLRHHRRAGPGPGLQPRPRTFQDMLERMLGAADGQRDKLTDVSSRSPRHYHGPVGRGSRPHRHRLRPTPPSTGRRTRSRRCVAVRPGSGRRVVGDVAAFLPPPAQ